jgi:CheY-like chemotaxis protein
MTKEKAETPKGVAGLTVLVVEDETIISLLLEDMLTSLGCGAVWHASGVSEALELLKERRPDAALLDVNLSGEPAYPVAEELESAGVPFIFSTGYGSGGLPARWVAKPTVQKPFTLQALEKALTAAL